MKELLEYLLKSILKHPEDLQVSQSLDPEVEGLVHLTVETHPEDTGLAIGKNGQVVNALKNLLKVAARSNRTRFSLDIRSQTDPPDRNQH